MARSYFAKKKLWEELWGCLGSDSWLHWETGQEETHYFYSGLVWLLVGFVCHLTLVFLHLFQSEMVALQEGLWDPLLEWFCCTYDVSITSTQSIIGPTVPEATIGEL